jgi:hypothetical protein
MPDWSFENLEFLIQERGDEVIHETAVSCTCRTEDFYGSMIDDVDGRPATTRKINCNNCGGNGWLYRNARVIKGLITGMQVGANRQLLDLGYAVPGDATFSPSLTAGDIGDFDRITFLHAEPVSEGQILMRNAANMGENIALDTKLLSTEDRLWYQAECTTWCEDEDGVLYYQNTDFEFDGKVLRWVGNTPNDGKFYTIKYTAFLEWIVYASPFDRVDRNRGLAQRVLLRKVHVAFPNDSERDTASKRQDEELEFTTRTKI